MKRLVSALALAGLVATGSAVAKPGDVYLFGHYTHSNFNGLSSLIGESELDSSKQEHNRFGFGAGYVLDDTWSFELGYKDLGNLKANFDDEGAAVTDYGKTKISSQAVVLRSIATLPITQEFKLEGSVGLALTRSKLNFDDYEGGYERHEYERRTTLAPTLGMGASYAFTDNLALFGRYEYIHNAIDSKVLSDDEDDFSTIHASTLDLGLRYTF